MVSCMNFIFTLLQNLCRKGYLHGMNGSVFSMCEEVREALNAKQPVVALESTIISHGMPYPHNLATARMLEATVRAEGAIPATVAVVDGVLRVGLEPSHLNALATQAGVMKLSRRDLAWAVAHKRTGATTVAATMIAAAKAGIAMFATGGIGGVHRGAELTWDVSADLTELARTPVNVVCAGPKAILDLPATLEYLETLGVPVVGYQTDELPAFYSRLSGLDLELRADSPEEVAAFIRTRHSLSMEGGVLVAQPVPVDFEISFSEMDATITAALEAASAAGIQGKALTPWLLGRIVALTGGKSLETNIKLVENNARLAARIAVALSRPS